MDKFFILAVLSVLCTSTVSCQSTSLRSGNGSSVRENYDRSDLLFISGVSWEYMTDSDGNSFHCEWKISRETLETQPRVALSELVRSLPLDSMIISGKNFCENYWKEKFEYESVEIIYVNDAELGVYDGKSRRNDWIIIVSFRNIKGDFLEKVMFLPDGRRIEGSNY